MSEGAGFTTMAADKAAGDIPRSAWHVGLCVYGQVAYQRLQDDSL